jgi:hypothetical protein
LIYVIGGVTYGEIASFRALGNLYSKNYILHIITFILLLNLIFYIQYIYIKNSININEKLKIIFYQIKKKKTHTLTHTLII